MELVPPGFRFFPTEEELVSFYLHNKLQGTRPELHRVIPVIDIYKFEPWDLPKASGELCHGDIEQWFFFTPIQQRQVRGGKPNRTTFSGYWKATGSPSYVYSSEERVIGVKKTMVFYTGRAPTGRKTKWKMNEYRAIKEEAVTSTSVTIPKLRNEFSLCRVYIITGSFGAFDRRPVPSIARSDPGMHRTSSTESSNSTGNCTNRPPAEGSVKNCEIVNVMETSWEWEDWLL